MSDNEDFEYGGEEAGEDGDYLVSARTIVTRPEPGANDTPNVEQEESLCTPRGSKLKKKTKKLPPIRINLSACKYEVLRLVQRKLGWREVGDEEDWELYWTDTSVSIERIIKLNKVQKINHFNGMLEICRKKSMARNLSKMSKLFPGHYDFFPKTFLLPNDIQELLADVKARGKKQIYIFKPDAGCQGRGIRLLQGGKEEAVLKLLKEMEQPNVVAQHYLAKPLLVHGYKFDMRIYALVLSCDPLRVFIFHEGLARFCTEKYTKPKPENLHISFMHLTNYAVNKHNENFVANQGDDDDDDASKWTLKQLAEHMEEEGHDWSQIWEHIQQLIVKSLASIQPVLRNNYRSVLPPDNDGFSCFEILGYDIMLDSQLQPWLIEVNHSPSFNIDSPLDLAIKEQLISDTMELVRIDPKLIAKAKKADKRAAAGRLLEPLQKKKPPGAPGPAAVIGPGPQASTGGGGTAGSAGAATVASGGGAQSTGGVVGVEESQAAVLKPKTAEEYEAMRAEVLRKREKWEAKHSGGFTRIYPTDDRTLQGLYDELIRGAAELFQSTFQAKAKKALDVLGEERKRKEETDSESVKAEKAKARALRDRLAQMAIERRKLKAADKPGGMGVGPNGSSSPANPLAGYVQGPNGMMYLVPGGASVMQGCGLGAMGVMGAGNGAPGGSWTRADGMGLIGWPGSQQRSEVWGESDQGYSPSNSLPGSRPISARSVDQRQASLSSRLGSGLLQHSSSGNARSMAGGAAAAAAAAALSAGAGGMVSGTNNLYNYQGGFPPQPFRGNGSRGGDGGGGGVTPGPGVAQNVGALTVFGCRSVSGGCTDGSAGGGRGGEASSTSPEGGYVAFKSYTTALRAGAASLSARDLALWGAASGGASGSGGGCTGCLPRGNATPAHTTTAGYEKLQSPPFMETTPQQPGASSTSPATSSLPGVSAASTPFAAAAVAGAPTRSRSIPATNLLETDLDRQARTASPALTRDRQLTSHTSSSSPYLQDGNSGGTTTTSNNNNNFPARNASPTIWRGAERTGTPLTGWGLAGSSAMAPSPHSAPTSTSPGRRPVPRPLSGHHHHAARLMAISAPADTSTSNLQHLDNDPPQAPAPRPCPRAAPPSTDPSARTNTAITDYPSTSSSPFGPALAAMQDLMVMRTAASLPPSNSNSTTPNTNPYRQVQGPTSAPSPSISDLPRNAALILRAASPSTSIYIAGPPPITPTPTPGQAPSGGSAATNPWGGTIQYASDTGYGFWPTVGGSGQMACNSFVIRPVPVSFKGTPKGGSLYTSLRPSPSFNNGGGGGGGQRSRGATQPCVSQNLLTVTGGKVSLAQSQKVKAVYSES